MTPRARRAALVHLLGSAVVMQALLSGSSFLIGLILLRRTSDLQYGYYVLMQNAIQLLIILQFAFIQPQLVTRISACDAAGRAGLIGGLYREQRALWPLVIALAVPIALLLRLLHAINTDEAFLILTAAAAVVAVLYREFFRMVMLGYRRPAEVLRADAVYVALLVLGVLIATHTPAPAAVAVVAMAAAAVVGGALCSRSLWRFEPWNIRGSPGILRALTPLGTWSASGAAVHWMLSQGYNYLVAGMLSVPAVAAIAATRLTIMPINLLSSGIGTIMLPTTAAWLNTHGARKVMRRSVALALLMAVVAICYFTLVWLGREWLFGTLLKKQFPQRDSLLLLWFAAGLAMLLRDQLLHLLNVRHRFRSLTSLTLLSAVVALSISFLTMPHIGVIGALLGVLTGEVLNVAGLLALTVLEVRRHVPVATA